VSLIALLAVVLLIFGLGGERAERVFAESAASSDAPSIHLDIGIFAANYTAQTVIVTGAAMQFGGGTTVQLRDSSGNFYGAYVSRMTVSSETTLTFRLLPGLAAKVYTLVVRNGNELATAEISVLPPMVTLTPERISSGHGAMLQINGTGTDFTTAGYEVALQNAIGAEISKIDAVFIVGPTLISVTLKDGLSPGKYTVLLKESGNVRYRMDVTVEAAATDPGEAAPVVAYSIAMPPLLLPSTGGQAKLYVQRADGRTTEAVADVTWASSRPHVAIVADDGRIQAVGVGETIIRAMLGGVTVSSAALVVADRIDGEVPKADDGDGGSGDSVDGSGTGTGSGAVADSSMDSSVRPAKPVYEPDAPTESLPVQTRIEDGRVVLTLHEADALDAIASSGVKRYRLQSDIASNGGTEARIPGVVAARLMSAGSDTELVISIPGAAYVLPIGQLKALLKGLDPDRLDDAGSAVRLIIEPVPEERQRRIIALAAAKKAEVLAPAMDFRLFIDVGGTAHEIGEFGALFVERSFILANGAWRDGAAVSAVTFDGDAVRHVPTRLSLSEDGQLRVSMMRNGNSEYAVLLHTASFEDVDSRHWAKAYIDIMAAKWIVSGKTESRFEPEATVTRAEFAAMLTRALGLAPASAGISQFQDVPPEAWFAAEVEAAYRAGLVSGIAADRFEPGRRINRQEMTAMLMRALQYAGFEGMPTAAAAEDSLSRFKDRANIDGYARYAMGQAVQLELVSGTQPELLDPKGSASRAQAAAVLLRMLRLLDWVN